MTKREIFANVLSEESSYSKDDVLALIDKFTALDQDVAATFDSEIPADQTEQLISDLRSEATNLLTWLVRDAAAIGQEAEATA